MPGLRPWKRSTEPWRESIYRDHDAGICATRMAKTRELGSASVERIYAEFTSRKARERLSLECPQVLGIDEHRVHLDQTAEAQVVADENPGASYKASREGFVVAVSQTHDPAMAAFWPCLVLDARGVGMPKSASRSMSCPPQCRSIGLLVAGRCWAMTWGARTSASKVAPAFSSMR